MSNVWIAPDLACVDCVLFASNGEVDNPSRDWHKGEAERFFAAGNDIAILDGEAFFSPVPCVVCGAALAGDRFEVEVFSWQGHEYSAILP